MAKKSPADSKRRAGWKLVENLAGIFLSKHVCPLNVPLTHSQLSYPTCILCFLSMLQPLCSYMYKGRGWLHMHRGLMPGTSDVHTYIFSLSFHFSILAENVTVQTWRCV